MAAEIYYPAREVASKYIELLPRFQLDQRLMEWAADYAMGHAGRCLWDARFLASRAGLGRVLNIGAAPYLFEMILREQRPDLELVAVDLDPRRFPGVEEALGIRVLQGNVESPAWKLDDSFDCIVFAEILEHLRIDLLGTLERVRAQLDHHGMLYLTTPNGLSFLNIVHHFLRGRTGPPPIREWGKLDNLGHMGHVREYSITEVTELLTTCGFAIDQITLRSQREGNWPLRDLAVRSRPRFAGEIVIVAHRSR
jgi:SAM-dependent methyltransferase